MKWPPTAKDEERFWLNVLVVDSNSCWFWTGAVNANGYGIFSLNNKPVCSHRIALALELNRKPRDCVLHTCDERLCCNPKHLYEGNQTKNVSDMDSRGRRGVRPVKKLQPGDFQRIRNLHDIKTINELCDIFNVSRLTIKRVLRSEYPYA